MATKKTFEMLTTALPKEKPTTVLYQITMYDRGTREQQKQGYQKLADQVAGVGAKLVIVSTPPVEDSFMDSYRDQAATTMDSARTVAEKSGGKVRVLDASQLWGTDQNAKQAMRAEDATHNCQQGAAAFAAWFTKAFADLGGPQAVAPEKWATGDWTGNEHFASYNCAAGGK
ncbi:hypothetical protein [Rathayibacter toxicus]|uniref:hypothetical protein n=1 Tax=Rathayibacter toxicus TaxID=145458 RepID=UPI001C04413A|nr:hypothetical protein [Rathayibacter toxicus]QWL32744.1 hypothetical protein E2R35_07900 [Rathayibacter toxicus]QWL34839.1 hypothetical protein E2R36_07905 [Rathayibacter toxicus]QWL36970.1 hypothetical protein E2R37_07900 [Rathayibacter toxicus]QWL39062.1 hypothetical protein E2R38_07895 [Rathayibacter toxicus]QWL41148.1 hypothetical protein E2R39_07900 [Rathayibacter toxicus]